MTDQERNQVLKMIEEGKITPEQGLTLMQALDQQGPDVETVAIPGAPAGEEPNSTSSAKTPDPDPHIERLKETARRLWQIPLWAGVFITILSALGMYAILRGPGMNFWFYFLLMPLLLGVALTALAAGSRAARWIYVDVHQQPGERPGHIFLGFPLPLKFTAWFLRTFGQCIPNLQTTNVDEFIQVMESGFSRDEPLIVHVDEGDTGERVQVYIG
ncbi:MAG: hypothetical protein ABSA23_01480 [Anaerolineales bacterium]|jgi:hypothetical protein